MALVHVAFGVGLRAQVGGSGFGGVRHSFVQVRQWHSVFLVDIALKLGLHARPLIVRECQRDQSLWLTHKFINVAFACHLDTRTML